MNIIQISQEIQKSQVEIHLYPYAKNDCQCANFHKTDAYSTTFCNELPHPFSRNPNKWFSH